MNRDGDIAGMSPRAVAMFLHRYGENVTVYDDTGTTQDVLNHSHPDTADWEAVGEALCISHYQSDESNEEADYDSGSRYSKEIRFIFAKDSIIEDGNHIIYRGEEFAISGLQHRATHSAGYGKLQNEGAVNPDG